MSSRPSYYGPGHRALHGPHFSLGHRARARSLRWGVFLFGLSLGCVLLMHEYSGARWLIWVLAVLVARASYSLIAGLLGVCAFSGFRGERFADYGHERILDQVSRRDVRRRALLVLSLSLLIAGLVVVAFIENT